MMSPRIILSASAWLFAACAPETQSFVDGAIHTDATRIDSTTHDGTGGDSAYTSTCTGHSSTLSGHTYAPNGTDPIPGVLVYVVPDSQTLPPAAMTVQCQTCANPPAAIAGTQSGPDGAFSISNAALDVGGTFTVVFESGGFRHVERHVQIGMCAPLDMTSMQTRLPGTNAGDDTIPRIAVAGFRSGGTHSGDVNDKFVKVLDAIGITGFDTVDPDKSGSNSGSGPDLIGLLSNMSQLSQYQIVITPCGSLGNFAVATHLTPTMIANLRAWLALGGRLYSSDLAYSVVDQSAPGAITFANGMPTRGDPADIGVGIDAGTSIPGSVDDATLRSWLQNVSVLAPGATTIPITDLRDPWGAMDSIPEAELTGTSGPTGTVLVSGDVSWHNGTSGHHPLTAMVDVAGATGNCGRVVFTSYHVVSTTTGTGTALTPQERVLEYLFFRLSTCIAVPG